MIPLQVFILKVPGMRCGRFGSIIPPRVVRVVQVTVPLFTLMLWVTVRPRLSKILITVPRRWRKFVKPWRLPLTLVRF